jgi:mannosyltransferase OCH1-like enzyme
VVHASDILRYITLWKYGGTYLDMDFVIRKWVHYYRLQTCPSWPFILATFWVDVSQKA